MSAEIRTAVAEDRNRCVELLGLLSERTGSSVNPHAGDAFTGLLDRSRGEIVVADDAGRVLGMASISFNLAMRYGGEYCQLEELIVDPEARGQNLGARLVEATVERARNRGCGEFGLYLVASTESNRVFYEKFGFEVVGSEMRQVLGASPAA